MFMDVKQDELSNTWEEKENIWLSGTSIIIADHKFNVSQQWNVY
jgi:hypothetical protein